MTSLVRHFYCSGTVKLNKLPTKSCTNPACISKSKMSQQEDEQVQRPELTEEDLADGRNRLGLTGPAKSKTLEVMEECEKVGKAAPSVFSKVRSGGETVLNTRPPKK